MKFTTGPQGTTGNSKSYLYVLVRVRVSVRC